MDTREARMMGRHVIEFEWWIFAFAFTVYPLRDITTPRWLGLLLCKFGKHSLWINKFDFRNPEYKCLKCGLIFSNSRRSVRCDGGVPGA